MTLQEAIDILQKLIDIQSSSGNSDYDEYMRGLVDGLILAKSVLTKEVPEFHDPILDKIFYPHCPPK